jgi:hypothetical protein
MAVTLALSALSSLVHKQKFAQVLKLSIPNMAQARGVKAFKDYLCVASETKLVHSHCEVVEGKPILPLRIHFVPRPFNIEADGVP